MPRRYYQYSRRAAPPKFNFDPEINKGLVAILLFLVAGLAALSFFNMAGVAGKFIDSLLAIIFGQVRYVFPIILIIVATLMIKDMEYRYKPTHLIGTILFFLSFNGLMHLRVPVEQMVDTAMQGYNGGLAGVVLAWLLAKYVSVLAGGLILVCLLLVAVIFLFNTSLAQIVELNRKFFLMLGWCGRNIVEFFALFKKGNSEKVKFSIKGEYKQNTTPEPETEDEKTEVEEPEDDEEENKRRFLQKALAKKEAEDKETEAREEIEVARPDYTNFKLPPVELLSNTKSKPTSGDIEANAETIRDTLQNFGIEVDMGEERVGPTVTQYSMKQ